MRSDPSDVGDLSSNNEKKQEGAYAKIKNSDQGMHSDPSEVGDLPPNNEKKQEGDYAKIKNSDQDGQNKIGFEHENDGKKVQYNPTIHSTKTRNDYRAKKLFRKREKQKKEKRKATEKESDYLQDLIELRVCKFFNSCNNKMDIYIDTI